MPSYTFTKAQLQGLYWDEELNPYEIAERFGCDHKTIRAHLKKLGVKLRTSSEYNFLPKKNYEEPSNEELMTALSIKAHMAYLCEGSVNGKNEAFSFCNTNPKLIELQHQCLVKIYHVDEKGLRYWIQLTKGEEKDFFLKKYPKALFAVNDKLMCPLIQMAAGGRNLASLYISNAKNLMSLVESS